MAWKSIRFRLTVWYSLALAGALLLFAGALWLSMWHSLRKEVNNTLHERVASIDSFLRDELQDPAVDLGRELGEYSHALPYGTFVEVTPAGEIARYTSKADFPWPVTAGWQPGTGRVRWRNQTYQILVENLRIQGGQWRITFAVSLENIEGILARLSWLLFSLVPLAVLIAPLGGAWLSRRALKPVDEITAAARQIGIQNLSERLTVQSTGDEFERLASTWNSMLSRLEGAVSRLSQFTSDASHELRTPLAVIRATAEIAARKSRSSESYRTALERIVDEADRMTALIDDLLFLARCDSDDLDLPKEQLTVQRIVSEVYSVMKPVAEANGINLLLRGGEANCRIVGNESAIRRLLLILVDNAVKYCRPGGSATVFASETSDGVRLSVEDEGPGIPQGELPLVFQRFYRGSKARDKGNNGFGLGLALAQGIAEQHHSNIEVSSVSGQGSVFTVVFPPEAK